AREGSGACRSRELLAKDVCWRHSPASLARPARDRDNPLSFGPPAPNLSSARPGDLPPKPALLYRPKRNESSRARFVVRALVIGAAGQVAPALLAALRERGHEAIGTFANHPADGLSPLDVTDAAAVTRAVSNSRPDWVLCPAGLTHVDYCEDHPAEAF